MVSGIVLAGGASRRFNMGTDSPLHKGLAPVHGRPMIMHVLERLQETCSDIFVVVNTFEVKRVFEEVIREHANDRRGGTIEVLVDEPTTVQGPLRGLITGLQHVNDRLVLTSACDTVIPSLLLKEMVNLLSRERIDVVIIQAVTKKLESTLLGLTLSDSFRSKLMTLAELPRGRLAHVARLAPSLGIITPLRENVIANVNTRKEWNAVNRRGFPRLVDESEIKVQVLRETAASFFAQHVEAMLAGDHVAAAQHLRNELRLMQAIGLTSLTDFVERDLQFLHALLKKR